MTFQLLLSSEYNINIVAQDLNESFETFHQILFAILLVLQNYLIISGLESILKQFHSQKETAEKYSLFGFLCATVWDTVLTMYVYALSFENEVHFSYNKEKLYDIYYPSTDRLVPDHDFVDELPIDHEPQQQPLSIRHQILPNSLRVPHIRLHHSIYQQPAIRLCIQLNHHSNSTDL